LLWAGSRLANADRRNKGAIRNGGGTRNGGREDLKDLLNVMTVHAFPFSPPKREREREREGEGEGEGKPKNANL